MTNHSGEWPAEAISLIGKQREEIERLQSLSHAVRLFIFAAKRDSWPVVDHGYFKRMEAALLDVQAPAEPSAGRQVILRRLSESILRGARTHGYGWPMKVYWDVVFGITAESEQQVADFFRRVSEIVYDVAERFPGVSVAAAACEKSSSEKS